MPADDLQVAIEEAQTALKEGANALVHRDPMRLMLMAQSAVLSVFGRNTTRWERAVQGVIDARVLSDADRTAMAMAAQDGAYTAMRKEANRMVRTIDRRLMTQFALTVGGAFVAGGLLVFGTFYLWQVGPYSPDVERAAAWSAIIRSNPDPNPALANAEIRTDQAGRRYYAKLSLWMDPAKSPPK
jgi:hypothetical protein